MFVWTISDAVDLAVLLVVILAVAIHWLLTAIKQAACGHPTFHENRACNAICSKCGKDLGFVGAWRKVQAGRATHQPTKEAEKAP